MNQIVRRRLHASDIVYLGGLRLKGVTDSAAARIMGLTDQDVRVLATLVGSLPPRRVYNPLRGTGSLGEVAFDVAQRHGMTVETLRGYARSRRVAWPRQEAFWLSRQIKRNDGSQKYSFPQIGLYYGGRDHTTVMHGVRAHAARLEAAE